MKTSEIIVKSIDPKSLSFSIFNPPKRVEQINGLMEHIRDHGIQVPVQYFARATKNIVVRGNRRTACAMALDLDKIPAIQLPEMTEAEEKSAIIADQSKAFTKRQVSEAVIGLFDAGISSYKEAIQEALPMLDSINPLPEGKKSAEFYKGFVQSRQRAAKLTNELRESYLKGNLSDEECKVLCKVKPENQQSELEKLRTMPKVDGKEDNEAENITFERDTLEKIQKVFKKNNKEDVAKVFDFLLERITISECYKSLKINI